jgi:hypothetical protein
MVLAYSCALKVKCDTRHLIKLADRTNWHWQRRTAGTAKAEALSGQQCCSIELHNQHRGEIP